MKYEDLRLDGVNTTLVYDNLNKDLVSRDELRKISDKEKPIINEFPDAIFVTFNESKESVVFENRRIIISKPIKEDMSTKNVFKSLSKLTTATNKAAYQDGLVAFGLNYDGIGKVSKSLAPVANYFKNSFNIKSQVQLEKAAGELTVVYPKFTLRSKDCDFNISLEPTDQANTFKFHLNAHFSWTTLVSEDELNTLLNAKLELFCELLEII